MDQKDVLLSFVGAACRRCIEAVETTELANGHLTDAVDIEDRKFLVHITYFREGQMVRISGRSQPREQEQEFMQAAGMPPQVAKMFGFLDDDGDFDFALPAAWVPVGVETRG